MANKKNASSKKKASSAAKSNETKSNTVIAKAEAKAEQIVKTKEKDKANGTKKPNPIVKYFKDLKSEFKKVVWPSKKTVINNTSVVLVVMALSGLVIWGIDSLFTELLKLLVG